MSTTTVPGLVCADPDGGRQLPQPRPLPPHPLRKRPAMHTSRAETSHLDLSYQYSRSSFSSPGTRLVMALQITRSGNDLFPSEAVSLGPAGSSPLTLTQAPCNNAKHTCMGVATRPVAARLQRQDGASMDKRTPGVVGLFRVLCEVVVDRLVAHVKLREAVQRLRAGVAANRRRSDRGCWSVCRICCHPCCYTSTRWRHAHRCRRFRCRLRYCG